MTPGPITACFALVAAAVLAGCSSPDTFTTSSGLKTWHHEGEPFQQADQIHLHAGMVLALTSDGDVLGFDAETGRVKWTAEAPFEVNRLSSIVASDRLFVGSEAGTWAIRLDDGQTIWSNADGGTPLDFHADTVLVRRYDAAQGPESGSLPALWFLSLDDGRLVREIDLAAKTGDNGFFSGRVYNGCLVYLGRFLHGVSLWNEACAWELGHPAGFGSSVFYGAGFVYIDADYPEEGVWRLDPVNGETQIVLNSVFEEEQHSIVRRYAEWPGKLYALSSGRMQGDLGLPNSYLQAIDTGRLRETWTTSLMEETSFYRLEATEGIVVGQGTRNAGPHEYLPFRAVDLLVAWDADTGVELWRWEHENVRGFSLDSSRVAVSWLDDWTANGMTIDALTGESPLQHGDQRA